MASDPAALLYIDKWYAATVEMSSSARAYYMDMILRQFKTGSIPNDIESLATICRVRISEFDLFKQVFNKEIKHLFEQNSEGRLENPTAREIIQKRKKFVDKRSISGKMSYIVRYATRVFNASQEDIAIIKEHINPDEIDTKNEQVLKQVLKQIFELYINVNVDINKNINNNTDTTPPSPQEPKKKKKFVRDNPPSLKEWTAYCKEHGFESIASRSYISYKEANWEDSQGNPLRNWKQKLQQVWFREENKGQKNNDDQSHPSHQAWEGYSDK